MALKLPRFLRDFAIVEENNTPTIAFHQWWERVLTQVETSINGIQDALDAAGIAQAAADTAQAAAASAQSAADSAQSTAKLASSGVSGITITGTDAGSNATVNISAHTRIYGDGASVSVNSGSLTGLLYSTLYYIYYDDASFAGGAVTYVATTDSATAAQTGNRHTVGSVTTPAAAAPDTGGGYPPPPGQGFTEP